MLLIIVIMNADFYRRRAKLLQHIRDWLEGYVTRVTELNIESKDKGFDYKKAAAIMSLLTLFELYRSALASESITARVALTRQMIEVLGDAAAIFDSNDPAAQAKLYIDHSVEQAHKLSKYLDKVRENGVSNTIARKRIFQDSGAWSGKSLTARVEAIDKTKRWINEYDLLSNFAHLNPIRHLIADTVKENDGTIISVVLEIVTKTLTVEGIFNEEELNGFMSILKGYDALPKLEVPVVANPD